MQGCPKPTQSTRCFAQGILSPYILQSRVSVGADGVCACASIPEFDADPLGRSRVCNLQFSNGQCFALLPETLCTAVCI